MKNKTNKKVKKYFSASDVGSATRCTKWFIASKEGRYTSQQNYTIKQGNRFHEQLTERTLQDMKGQSLVMRIWRFFLRLLWK